MSAPKGMGSSTVALPAELDLLIIGGGVMGLSIAYNLARLAGSKLGKVAVVEQSYLVSGASGRNGGGLRMQWGDADLGDVELRDHVERLASGEQPGGHADLLVDRDVAMQSTLARLAAGEEQVAALAKP